MRKVPTQSGFQFLKDLPSPLNDGEEDAGMDLTGLEAVRGQRFANIFLNSAKNINAKYNVVDTPEAKSVNDSSKTGTQKKIQVSRSSRNRAELVKATFEIKYRLIKLSLNPMEQDAIEHEGIEGVYNPLQVIRNRIVRQALQYHSPSTYQTLPLACNTFSSHSANGKIWSMLWGIKLNDFVADFGWRRLHWNQLRNSKGELWFPEDKTKAFTEGKKRNLHDKLWDGKDSDSIEKAEEMILTVPIMTIRRKKTRATKRLRKNIRKKAKRLYGSGSAGSSVQDQDSTDNGSNNSRELESSESISKVKIDRVSGSPSVGSSGHLRSTSFRKRASSEAYDTSSSEAEMSSEEMLSRNVAKNVISDKLLSQSQNPNLTWDQSRISPIATTHEVFDNRPLMKEHGSVSDVSFAHANFQNSLSKDLDSSISEQISSSGAECELESPDEIREPQEAAKDYFAILDSKERFLRSMAFLTSYYLGSIYPKLLESAEQKTVKLHNDVMKNILQSALRINDEYLPAQENLCRGFLDETNTLMHLANDKHAVRIDNLLSATDRSYNELNTSMLMEYKKVSEQLDKLNLKFFGSAVTSVLRDTQGNVLTSGRHYQALYFVLENVIVIVLRLIWISANILKIFLFVFKGIFFLFSGLGHLLT